MSSIYNYIADLDYDQLCWIYIVLGEYYILVALFILFPLEMRYCAVGFYDEEPDDDEDDIVGSFFLFKPSELLEVILWPFHLPLPCAEEMNSIVQLYSNVMNINFCVLLVVLFFICEALDSSRVHTEEIDESKDTDNTTKKEKIVEPEKPIFYFYGFPIHLEVAEEHLIDIVVIVVPTLIVLNQIVPTLGFLYNQEFLLYETVISFQVNVVGNQWFWSYEYIINLKIDDISFSKWVDGYSPMKTVEIMFTFNSVLVEGTETNIRLLDVDKSLVLPVHTNVLFSFSARDVIHAWTLPQMGLKVDCMPGRMTSSVLNSYSLGVFYGQCSELCGPLHGFMPICVEMVLPDTFVLWALLEAKMYSSDFDFSYYDIVEKLLGSNIESPKEKTLFTTEELVDISLVKMGLPTWDHIVNPLIGDSSEYQNYQTYKTF